MEEKPKKDLENSGRNNGWMKGSGKRKKDGWTILEVKKNRKKGIWN